MPSSLKLEPSCARGYVTKKAFHRRSRSLREGERMLRSTYAIVHGLAASYAMEAGLVCCKVDFETLQHVCRYLPKEEGI